MNASLSVVASPSDEAALTRWDGDGGSLPAPAPSATPVAVHAEAGDMVRRPAPPAVVRRRELQQWVATSRDRLAARGVCVVFGFGPSIGREEGASWASFTSRRGSGRLVRAADGASRVNVHAFTDGACLHNERADRVSLDQLEQIADLLT